MKKILAILLSMILAAGCLAGCGNGGGKAKKDDATEIEIAYWSSGLGEEWLKNTIKAFNEKYPEYNVTYTASATPNNLVASYGMADIDTVDLYMSVKKYDTEYMEPLDDVLEATADGDKMPLKDKFNSNYLKLEQASDGHYYTLTYGGGVVGMVYNKEMFKEAGITQLPRTTDEFASTCLALRDEDYVPLCHFGDEGYYRYLMNVFMMQYDGFDYYYNNFWGCTDAQGNSPSKEVFTTKDGRYYGLKACEKFVTAENTMNGSSAMAHTEVQTKFLNGSAAMMINGSWLQNEMRNQGNMDNFSEMRFPVLSSIVNKLSTVKTDKELRTLITAIDQVADGEKQLSDFQNGENYVIDDLTVSATDWDIVYAARGVVSSNYAGASTFIPTYSNAKEGAKEFLKFMNSDEGYQIYLDALKLPKPMVFSNGEDVDTSSYTAFEKLQFELMNASEYFADYDIMSKSRIFTDGDADYLADVTFANVFTTLNKDEKMSADEVWNLMIDTINDNYESNWLANIK